MSILNEASKLGVELLARANIRAQLALSAARAVVDGKATPKDADDIYVAYLDAVVDRSTLQPYTSRKVQVSKLRQIMKLAAARPNSAVELLERVVRLHAEFDGRPMQLFEAMVEISRVQLQQSKQLTNSELVKLMARR